MHHSSPYFAIRKATPIKASGRSATNSDNKPAERFAGHGLQDAPQLSRKLSRADRLAALDALMADRDRLEAWISQRLHRSIDDRQRRWANSWDICLVREADRPEVAAAIERLRQRDPLIRQAIKEITWAQGVTVWFWEGAGHD